MFGVTRCRLEPVTCLTLILDSTPDEYERFTTPELSRIRVLRLRCTGVGVWESVLTDSHLSGVTLLGAGEYGDRGERVVWIPDSAVRVLMSSAHAGRLESLTLGVTETELGVTAEGATSSVHTLTIEGEFSAADLERFANSPVVQALQLTLSHGVTGGRPRPHDALLPLARSAESTNLKCLHLVCWGLNEHPPAWLRERFGERLLISLW